MGSLTTNLSAIGAVTRELAAFLKANMPSLAQALEGWPATNQKLNYPAATVLAKTPVFSPLNPYVVFKGAVTGQPTQKLVRRVVGMYDFKMQLDLWCAYKPQRDSIVEELIMAFNTKPDVPGIDLQLSTYFGEWTHLSVESIEYVEDEAGTQRSEFRAMISILGNVRVLNEQTGYVIQTIENTLETPAQIAAQPSPESDDLTI